MDAETVDSPTAVGVKGSSPLEVRKTFSMVLLEVRILLHTPSFVKVSARERHATQHSSKVLLSRRLMGSIPTVRRPFGGYTGQVNQVTDCSRPD